MTIEAAQQSVMRPVAALMIFGASIANATETPISIIGQWRVVSGETDNYATTYFNTKIDDPRYVGRVVRFDNDVVSGEAAMNIDCQQPAYLQQSPMTLNEVIVKTSGERRFPPIIPVAEDFGLNGLGKQKITPIVLQCQQGHLGPDGESIGNWVALLSADKLLMYWNDNSYFVLKRVTAEEKITPTFSCNAKLSDTEQVICSDNELAAWDRSVNDAYTIQLQQQQDIDPADKAALAGMKAAQRDWLKKRNQCQADAACLTKSMRDRTFELVSKIQ
ncbi:Protein of unknown function [Kosakonia arachidis]|uniref:Lysozyme inhibitor LprI-like N-terminal domain-containing protein n=1 Tax=Kosakonia arachidis TaxID=551989 RepID=A0A1I7DAN3_9ENTR|nr:lysozyme inhibitor LprI family protein [Kosakonia arachidis]SFU08697.1 Protein of unknown function [Kosakonia arachidis]